MIDLHTHLDLYPNALDILGRVSNENHFTLAVTTSPRAWMATSQIFQKKKNIKVALGLHPEIVDKKFNEVDMLLNLIPKATFIGEVGIDGSDKHSRSFDMQKRIFDTVLRECEKEGGRVISIHSRAATSKVLSIISKHPNCGVPILHWFSGSSVELERAIEMRCYFSVNPLMLKSKKGRELASKMPHEFVLPESDGPFTILNGKPIMPWEAINVCSVLSTIWGIEGREVMSICIKNLNQLLKAGSNHG